MAFGISILNSNGPLYQQYPLSINTTTATTHQVQIRLRTSLCLTRQRAKIRRRRRMEEGRERDLMSMTTSGSAAGADGSTYGPTTTAAGIVAARMVGARTARRFLEPATANELGYCLTKTGFCTRPPQQSLSRHIQIVEIFLTCISLRRTH